MTRFARAKGSKSSNEKTPEDSTPWEVMKEQLMQAKKEGEEAKKREEAEKQRIENYENFLKEHKVQKRKATWCDFPEDNPIEKKLNVAVQTNEPKKKQRKKNIADENDHHEAASSVNSAESNKKKKKNKNKVQISTELETKNDSTQVTQLPVSSETKKKNKKNKQKNINSDSNKTNNTVQEDHSNPTSGESNQKDIKKAPPNPPDPNKLKKKKKNKLVNGQPVRRKEIDSSFQLIINSKEVELVRFDGFPIMKKDAERLQELKNSMIKKGIPKSEVQRTMKLERRRAEKALARLKREVCYNCRKGGHNLSDCPELKSKIPGAAEGICFKCGSTEHRQFECKVQRDKEFRFATCFICKEPGHIARQCPDNPKGLYPNGGSCKLCGDVTHLRKDCPTVNEQKESTSIKLQTLDTSDNLEEIGQQTKTTISENTSKKPKKIKF